MELLEALFGGDPPGLSTRIAQTGGAGVPPADPEARAALPAAEVRSLTLAAPLPPPRRKVLEGLSLLWHDHWDAAHAVAQSHEGQPDYDLLHAIGHRREGDYPNADYWFRSAGRHPAFGRLAAAAEPLLAGSPLRGILLPGGAWSAQAFTAEVRKAAKGGVHAELLVRLQALEMRGFAGWLLSA